MEPKKANESEKVTRESLLEHYSNETCSHIEAAISLFFGLIGTLILMTVVNTVAARVVFSIMYFVLGGLGVYFYVRLFYYRTLLEGILLDEPYKDYHIKLQDRAFKRAKVIKWTQQISRRGHGEYQLWWAWVMLAVAVVVAFASWIIVAFSL
ncbi:MAG: hypothetical protein OEZ40_07205 [Candidatus Bathyarchaeota archaeon]|nr:hypothetical protein [Candidatus Bathyarchaeota archaeon]